MKSIGEGQLQYNGTPADTNYYNIAKDLAIINARNEEITDREGHLYGYWCNISTTSIADDLLSLAMIPNTWKVRNAFRKFHFARDHMFRESGVTKSEMGKYGRTMRVYFSTAHAADGDQPLKLFDVVNETLISATGGEWTYSRLASAPSYLEGEDTANDVGTEVDSWNLAVLGDHRAASTSPSGIKVWDTVAMVKAYNQDRMEEIPDATTATSIVSPNNPLAALRSQSVMSGEVTEIAEDQELEAPPYDVTDLGDSTQAVYDYMPVSQSGQAQKRHWGTFFVPAGLIALRSTAANSNALEIEVIGKELCKDVV